jgi:hypothetical protein
VYCGVRVKEGQIREIKTLFMSYKESQFSRYGQCSERGMTRNARLQVVVVGY